MHGTKRSHMGTKMTAKKKRKKKSETGYKTRCQILHHIKCKIKYIIKISRQNERNGKIFACEPIKRLTVSIKK